MSAEGCGTRGGVTVLRYVMQAFCMGVCMQIGEFHVLFRGIYV